MPKKKRPIVAQDYPTKNLKKTTVFFSDMLLAEGGKDMCEVHEVEIENITDDLQIQSENRDSARRKVQELNSTIESLREATNVAKTECTEICESIKIFNKDIKKNATGNVLALLNKYAK